MSRAWNGASVPRLLNRDTRHVGLTEAGAFYREHCRHVLAQREHAEAEVGALGRLPRGRLRVSAPYDFGAAEVELAVLAASARPDRDIWLDRARNHPDP